MVAVELEAMAKKYDRFGWDRDRATTAQDRQITDWMDALQDYPLDEIQSACSAHVIARPDKMPNEGHILGMIIKARSDWLRVNRPAQERETQGERVSKERATEIMQEAGYRPKMMKGELI